MPLYTPGGVGGTVGTTAGTVAAGDDSRITGAAQKSANLSDLASASTARTNLGLGNAATKNVGTTTGTVAAGDDARLPTTAEKTRLAAMPPVLLINDAASLPAGTAAGTVVVVKA